MHITSISITLNITESQIPIRKEAVLVGYTTPVTTGLGAKTNVGYGQFK